MSFLKGNASFVCFSVEGEMSDNSADYIAKRVAAYSFKEIDDTYDESSIGWVSVHNMFDASFAYASFLVGSYIVFSLRVDERKVSPAILKKFVLKEEEKVRTERQVPRLSRSTRLQIKERVHSELIRKAFPVPAVYDLCWNLAESRLLIFTTNKKVHSLIEDFFKECFGLLLRQQIPFVLAETIVNEADRVVLDAIKNDTFLG
jgi:DNA recombination-dependent growth factor C